jgi:hypothetical protein
MALRDSIPNLTARRDLLVIAVGAALVFVAAQQIDLLESILEFAHAHESWEIDELLTMAIFLTGALAVYTLRRWTEADRAHRDLQETHATLQKALSEIKVLRGFIPICANCKRVRDDTGYWEQVEAYVSRHTEAMFSHGICPDCMQKLYPDYAAGLKSGEERVN